MKNFNYENFAASDTFVSCVADYFRMAGAALDVSDSICVSSVDTDEWSTAVMVSCGGRKMFMVGGGDGEVVVYDMVRTPSPSVHNFAVAFDVRKHADTMSSLAVYIARSFVLLLTLFASFERE